MPRPLCRSSARGCVHRTMVVSSVASAPHTNRPTSWLRSTTLERTVTMARSPVDSSCLMVTPRPKLPSEARGSVSRTTVASKVASEPETRRPASWFPSRTAPRTCAAARCPVSGWSCTATPQPLVASDSRGCVARTREPSISRSEPHTKTPMSRFRSSSDPRRARRARRPVFGVSWMPTPRPSSLAVARVARTSEASSVTAAPPAKTPCPPASSTSAPRAVSSVGPRSSCAMRPRSAVSWIDTRSISTPSDPVSARPSEPPRMARSRTSVASAWFLTSTAATPPALPTISTCAGQSPHRRTAFPISTSST